MGYGEGEMTWVHDGNSVKLNNAFLTIALLSVLLSV